MFARYPKVSTIGTTRDPLSDLLVMAEFLESPDYVVEILSTRHNVSAGDAARRAARIGPHVRTALAYLTQAFSGPAEVAFLPAYYGILNLIKVYILTSSKHMQLNQNRWHGAAYDVYRKASRNLKTEEVTVHPHGAISLFYEVITGRSISQKTRIKMGDVYPYIQNVGAEWDIAASPEHRLRGADIVVTLDNGAAQKSLEIRIGHRPHLRPITLRNLPFLVDVRRGPPTPFAEVFHAKSRYPATMTDDEIMSRHLRRELFYCPLERNAFVALCTSRLLMFEELPIVLAFFHLSSVARYNPELLTRLRESRYWPVISSLRYHGVARFMLLFWSHIQQELILFK